MKHMTVVTSMRNSALLLVSAAVVVLLGIAKPARARLSRGVCVLSSV